MFKTLKLAKNAGYRAGLSGFLGYPKFVSILRVHAWCKGWEKGRIELKKRGNKYGNA